MLRELASSFVNAARSMRRRPAFFIVSTATLGIALGFATTILGVVDTVRHPPMPFDDPDHTFQVRSWVAAIRVHPGPSRDEINAMLGQLPAVEALITHVKAKLGQAPDSSTLATGRRSTRDPEVAAVSPCRPTTSACLVCTLDWGARLRRTRRREGTA